ncbi:MAG: helix-turn-helix domain-containing protein [Thermomicrobiales bacterium]
MATSFQQVLDEIYSETVDDASVADAELAIDIATQFRALRERRELSQRAVAKLVGRTQQAISKIENPTHSGHSLSVLKEVVTSLDAVLDVTIVPLENLDAYRSLFPVKPALENMSDRQSAGSSTIGNMPSKWPSSASPDTTSSSWARWSTEPNVPDHSNLSSENTIVNFEQWLSERSRERVRHG